MRAAISFCCLLLLTGGTWEGLNTATAQVPLVIEVGELELTPGGTGSIDLTVTGSGQMFTYAGFEVRITANPGTTTPTYLRFLDADAGFLLDPQYVFFGNSFDADALADPEREPSLGRVVTFVEANDTFFGGDATANLQDMSLTGSRLFGRLNVMHDIGLVDPLTTIGDSFTLALAPAAGDSRVFKFGGAGTGFLNSSEDGVPYTSIAGTVTIVPEPSSIFIALCGVISATAVCRKLRRNRQVL